MGAAYLAGVATGMWPDLATASAQVKPARSVEPRRHPNRERWLDARARSERTVPELSSLDF